MKRLSQIGMLLVLLLGMMTVVSAEQPQFGSIGLAERTLSTNELTSYDVLSLDGVDDYVTIPHDPALNPTGAFTIEAWVKRADSARCETIISKGFQTAYWLGFCNGGRIRFYAVGNAYQDGNLVIPANVWTHIAVVYQGSGRRYYVNGELDYQGGLELAPTTNTLPVWIGSDPGNGCCDFQGEISNVRLWNVARTQDEIRRTMHQSLTGSRDGLVANWRFNGDLGDNIGGFDGTAIDGASITSDYDDPPPAQMTTVPLDENFNQMATGHRFNGIAYIPRLDKALIIGGRSCFGCVGADSQIVAVSAATGQTNVLDNLPTGSTKGTAAYVPTRDRVYYFGGVPDYHDNVPQDTIYAINPSTGAPTTLTTVLPQPLFGVTAVYHPVQDKVLLLGGNDAATPVNTISIFNPATESISATAAISLPEPLSSAGAAYSPLTDNIYVFGGLVSNTGNAESYHIYKIALNNSGDIDTITLLPTFLPLGFHFIQAISDPKTGLIYLSSGYNRNTGKFQKTIWIFDPLTNDIWDTHIFSANRMDGITGFYSSRQRHVLYIGGDNTNWDKVWRLPVGDGPLVSLGRWDFPTAVGAQVNDIDAAGSTAAIATNGDGAWLYHTNGAKSHLTAGMLGSASGVVNNIRYNDTYSHTFLATNDAGAQVYDGSTLGVYSGIGTNQVLSIDTRPGYTDVDAAPFVGAVNGLHYPILLGSPPFQLWAFHTEFSSEAIRAITHQGVGNAWVMSGDNLKNLRYTISGTTGTTNYGPHCGLLKPTDLTFAGNGDWWIVSPGLDEFLGNGICRIPAAATPGAGSTAYVDPTIGDWARRVSVDGEGRVWTALVEEHFYTTLAGSGGLAAFEVTGTPPGTLSTESWNWLSAPIGSKNYFSPYPYWESSLTAVGAADERVWLGKNDGTLVTLAQRWQQLDDSNGISSKIVQDVWTVRGRAFFATNSSLHVLQPDGETWDNRTTPRVWDVLGDSQGRIWVATDTGVRLYTPTGWDYLTDKPGTRPTTPVYALAEDLNGRIWMGGQNGLTLFDRERFVATFTPSNSDLPALPITDLFVDRRNRLWAGSNSGLFRLDGAVWTQFTTSDGLPDNRIHDITQLTTGEIVISTGNGLTFYNGSSFSTQTLPIPANDLPVVVDDGGYLYAGSAVYDGSAWTQYYTTNSGLASSQVSGLATDNADRVWFSHAPDAGVSVRGSYLPPLGTVIPQITGITPSSGSSGDVITINGSGFPDGRSVDVTIGSDTIRGYATSDTQIEVRIDDRTTSGDVSVQIRNGARTTQADAFCARPVITGFSPTGGNDGVWVTIDGTNFDYTAQVQLGGGTFRNPAHYDPTRLQTLIESGDGIGAVVVNNDCPGISATTTGTEFRRLTVSVAQMVLNQGIPSLGLVASKPTFVQHYLNTTPPARATDRVTIDSVQLDFTEGGTVHTYSKSINTQVPVVNDAPSAADLADIDNSLNTSVTPVLGGNLVDNVSIQSTLKNNGHVVAVGNTSAIFRPNMHLRVLLVPIMANNYTPSELYAMRAQVNTGLDDLRRRIFPLGNVELYWSPMIYTANDVIVFGGETVDVGNSAELYDASHNLDSARRSWNEHSDTDVLVAFGVVQNRINRNTDGVTGLAFWPDVSQMINAAGLSAVDLLCDVGSTILNVLTFGAVDSGCDLEIPLYVAWAESNSDSSQLIGHELGHTMGLVRIPSPNANLGDNFSHSTTDEIDAGIGGGTCADLLAGGATYREEDTLYRAPGVSDPVVNPIAGLQWRPALTNTAMFGTVTSEALFPGRGKAIMSYACQTHNQNVYFEPADVLGIIAEYTMAPGRSFADLSPLRQITSLRPTRATTAPTPIFVPGTRLYLSGEVTATATTGRIVEARVLGDVAPLDMSFVSPYALVQLDSSGVELARTGLYPSFRTAAQTSDTGFWATTLLAATGVTTIELRQDTTVLDSIDAGSQAPVVTLASPAGGAFSGSDVIPVTWTASDGDGDSLTSAILYSADGGSTWTQVASAETGTGTVNIPISQLAGSTNGRIKVTVSDGLHQGKAVSPPISVENQPPQPFIGAPAAGSDFLEGMVVELSGGAFDNLDLMVDSANLVWQSDRDGVLGSGATLDALLSVGNHTLTLTATNSAGVSASTSVTMTISGDYDFDGIADTDELTDGLNLLTPADAFSDADGDGLSLRVERKRNLNPNNPDSDGDGRNDGQEVGEGTNPGVADTSFPPDSLQVYPNSISLNADLSLDVPDPQVPLQLASRDLLTWTLTSDVSWLAAFKTQGQTPDQVTSIVNVDGLSGDGVYHGNLFFATNLGTVTVPVTLTATNVPIRKIYLPLVLKQ